MKKVLILCAATALSALCAVAFSASQKMLAVSADAPYSQGGVIGNDKARFWVAYDTGNPMTTEGAGIKLWIHATESGGAEKVYSSTDSSVFGTFNNAAEGGRRYDYFDIDLSCYTNSWYITLQRFHSNGTFDRNGPTKQLSKDNAFKVLYSWSDWSLGEFGSIGSVDAGLAAKALGGMHACSSSQINGYGAFANFDSTFVKNGAAWKTVGNLNDYTLSDFADGDTSYSGSAATVTNAYDKYEFVKQQYEDSLSSALSVAQMETDHTPAVVAVSSFGIVGIAAAAFVAYKKKKLAE